MSRPPQAAEPADLTALAGIKLGNYRLDRFLGRGRMGAVYLANDEALLRPTAIKILSWRVAEAHGQDPVQWFLAEARLVARINHPRVVQIYGAARQSDLCYIAMEFVEGRSAEAAVAEDGPMRPERATDVLLQAATALAAAHASGVVHRDVKPANLLLGPGGVAKLGDFGMALGLSDLRTGTAHLRVGTPFYTAPEIWRGEAATPAADVYSLGATYFQLLTGQPPFPGTDVASVEQAHLRAEVPDPRERVPGIPAACAELARRLLAKAPRERPSAQEVAAEDRRILQALAGEVVATTPAPPRPAALPPPPVARTAGAPAVRPPLPAWAEALGFDRVPFAPIEPGDWRFTGEPLGGLQARLVALAQDPRTGVIAVTGAEGSGRSSLCAAIGPEVMGSRRVVQAPLGLEPDRLALAQRLCRLAGAMEAPSVPGSVASLVERLARDGQVEGRPPLLVLDGVNAAAPSLSVVLALLGAALSTRAVTVLMTGATGLVPALRQAGLMQYAEAIRELEVPALLPPQAAAYVQGWIGACRPAGAPPLIASADALYLVGVRSAGSLSRVNCIAENMLVLAAAQGARTLTTFHAWTAPDRVRWAYGSLQDLPRRPERWPPPEVVEVIDASRRERGLPPWPRPGAAGGSDR